MEPCYNDLLHGQHQCDETETCPVIPYPAVHAYQERSHQHHDQEHPYDPHITYAWVETEHICSLDHLSRILLDKSPIGKQRIQKDISSNEYIHRKDQTKCPLQNERQV